MEIKYKILEDVGGVEWEEQVGEKREEGNEGGNTRLLNLKAI